MIPIKPCARTILAFSIAFASSSLASAAHADDSTAAAASASTAQSSSASASNLALGIPGGPNPDNGLPIWGFLVYPSFFIGAIYNSNLFLTNSNEVAGVGIQFAPNITAIDDQGIHKTTLSLSADVTGYPAASRSSANTQANAQSPNNVTGTVSLDHIWKPTADITVDATAGFTRQNGIFGTLAAAGSSFVSTNGNSGSAFQLGNAASQQTSNQVSAALSVEKVINDRWFVRGGVGGQDIEYEPLPFSGSSLVTNSLDGQEYNAFLRSGYWITPQVNGFIEVGGSWWRYQDDWYNSNTYHVIGGLSSDLIGLFRGEIYGGVQRQVSPNGTFAAVNAPDFGGRITYYPTRFITLAASLDQSFGSAAVQSITPIYGSASGDTLQARFQANYAAAQYWSVSAIAGWAKTTWTNTPLVENAWTFGGTVSYNYWRNIALTLNYQYTATTANRNYVNVYAENLVSAGLTYHY